MPQQINVEKRREWLRALRNFKYGIEVRAKLGVLQTVCEQVAAERKGKQTWEEPLWERDEWVTFLYLCIRNNEYPPKLLKAFVQTAEVTFLTPRMQPTVEKVLEAVDEVLRRLSKPLRTKFGVFV